MEIINFPSDTNLNTTNTIQVLDYKNSQKLVKQKVILNKNTFSFLLEGNKRVFSSDSQSLINNSNFILMKSGHCLMSEKLSKSKKYRSILLFFSDEILLECTKKLQLPNVEYKKQESIYCFTYDDFIRRYVNSLLDISNLSKEMQQKMLKTKLEEILLYLTEKCGNDFLNFLFTNNDDYSQKFIRTIENSINEKLTVKELAFLCNMSVSTFKREFKKNYNISPIKWFKNKRLEYAHHLLNKVNKKPSEIYLKVGYENLSSFTKAYKLKYGKIPKTI